MSSVGEEGIQFSVCPSNNPWFVLSAKIFYDSYQLLPEQLMPMFLQSKRLLRGWRKTPSIYMAAFFMSFYGGIYIVSIPFVIAFLGGTDKDLGLCASMGFVSYLMGCICTGPLLYRFNARRLAQVGSLVVTASVAVLLAIVVLNMRGCDLPHPVTLVIITSMVSGLLTSIYWPPIMGWLSTGYEGSDLNRRLGIYNMSWSVGLAVSPFLGGLLVEFSIATSLFAAVIFAALAFVAVTLAHPPELEGEQRESKDDSQVFLGPASSLLVRFRWTSRIALVTVFTCVGLMKTQLALLFTMELGFSKSQFGAATTVMWLFSCLVFFAASKTHIWQYRLVPLILAQMAVVLSMLMIIEGSRMLTFFLVAALVGLGQAFSYISHQFYAASQSTRRSGSMAMHEILLSAGQIMGFLVGGYLADFFGRRTVPYWFGLFAIIIGIAAQLAVWRLVPIRQSRGIRPFQPIS
jgi:MFS family permease